MHHDFYAICRGLGKALAPVATGAIQKFQKEPVFVSEYWMPEDRFEPIAEFAHRSTFSDTANNAVTEKIFVPKHQKERGTVQLRLDFGEP